MNTVCSAFVGGVSCKNFYTVRYSKLRDIQIYKSNGRQYFLTKGAGVYEQFEQVKLGSN